MKKNLKNLNLLPLGFVSLFSVAILSTPPVRADTQMITAAPAVESSDDSRLPTKPVDTVEQNGPRALMWADFGTHAVVMTVVMGAPKGDRFPITILDAHLVSDQGTQHIESEIDKKAVAQLLVDGKKAKGTLMIPGSEF